MAEMCAGWVNDAGDHHDCRFVYESPDHAFHGKSYCRFHLPMGEAGEGGKADWDDEQQAAISDDIVSRIKAEAEKPEDVRERLDFSGVVVPRRINLGRETVWKIDFSGAQFHGWADFAAARFHDRAYFDGAQFHVFADFEEAQFLGDADFRKARFHGWANFRKTWFHDWAFFRAARFHESAMFTGSSDISQVEMRRFNKVRFDGARFHDRADFPTANSMIAPISKLVFLMKPPNSAGRACIRAPNSATSIAFPT